MKLNKNIFVSTTFYKDNSNISEILKLCSDYEIECLELGSNHKYEEQLFDIVNKYNFEYLVHNYFPIPEESFVLNIASFDENIRKRSINHIKRAIDFCYNIGANLYTFHPGFLTDPNGSNLCDDCYDFQWDEEQLEKSNFNKSKSLMFNSLDVIIKYALSKAIKIAIETEGSVKKNAHLLMQQPEEFEEFFGKYSKKEIGINLNIGHLNLAANTFNFKKEDFINLIQDYIFAMELSHNNGIEDQHLPLELNGWYWKLIHDPRFNNAYKILEFRNTSLTNIIKNIELIQMKAYAF